MRKDLPPPDIEADIDEVLARLHDECGPAPVDPQKAEWEAWDAKKEELDARLARRAFWIGFAIAVLTSSAWFIWSVLSDPSIGVVLLVYLPVSVFLFFVIYGFGWQPIFLWFQTQAEFNGQYSFEITAADIEAALEKARERARLEWLAAKPRRLPKVDLEVWRAEEAKRIELVAKLAVRATQIAFVIGLLAGGAWFILSLSVPHSIADMVINLVMSVLGVFGITIYGREPIFMRLQLSNGLSGNYPLSFALARSRSIWS